jgi:hypothetical protein
MAGSRATLPKVCSARAARKASYESPTNRTDPWRSSSDNNRAPSSRVRRVLASGPAARPIQQKREPAKDKRRNEAREFAVNSVRAQRANHEGDQDPCSFSSPSWNQNTDATEDFKHSDDISSVGRVAPIRQPPGPSACRGTSQFRDAGPDKYDRQ